MIKQGCHNVTKITLEKPRELQSGSWVRELKIHMSGHNYPVTLSLFGKDLESITIKPVVEDEC